MESKQEALTEAQENHDEAVQELEEKEALLTEEKQVLENASFTQEGTDKEENLYWWIVAYETEREAKELVTSLTEEIEELKDTITEYEEAVAEAERNLALANRDLQEGEIEAEIEREKQTYQAENAQEIYEVTTGQGSFNEQQAKADYEEAQEKLAEFDRMIVDQVICAENDGVITAVYVEAGDTLTQDAELISVNDREEVTITLSVEEDDMDFTALGSQAQIVAAALPDQVFTGVVTEIGDAEIDSNTIKTTYSVAVTVQNPESLLYQVDLSTGETYQVEFSFDEYVTDLYILDHQMYLRTYDENYNTGYHTIALEENGEIGEEITGTREDGRVSIPAGYEEIQILDMEGWLYYAYQNRYFPQILLQDENQNYVLYDPDTEEVTELLSSDYSVNYYDG